MESRILIFIILTTTLKLSTSDPHLMKPQVTTQTCKYIGKTSYFRGTPVDTYLGIPFARRPIGNLRFRKPLPPPNCNAPIMADRMRSACVQFTTIPFPWMDNMSDKGMDCLYLNVWVPPVSDDHAIKMPVMVFLHGGGFRIGSNRLDYFDGRVMAAVGGVVVVVPNYRLGTEGFLYFGTKEAPGNMGLYDILESLKWVRSNIAYFGGDEDKVTVFGQSSGAIAIGMLMVSPLTEGLFQRAVLQSGSPANLDAEDNDRDWRLSKAVAEEVGCWTQGKEMTPDDVGDVVACLRRKDALELTKTVGKVSDNPQRGLYPRYGDEILPHNARQSLIQGDFKDMPILIGNNKDEGATMITKVYQDEFGFHGDKYVHINKTFGEYVIRNNFKNFSDIESLLENYLGDVEDEPNKEVGRQVLRASGDYARVCPSVFMGEAVSAKGNPVYYYVFKHRPSSTPFSPWMGVVHFDETPFVFGYPLRYPDNYTLQERILSARMLRIWCNFATTGHPLKNWPLFSRSHPYYLEIKDDSRLSKSKPSENCDFFRPYFGFE